MAEYIVHEVCQVYQDREWRCVGEDLSWLNDSECELYRMDAAFGMGGLSQNTGPDESRALVVESLAPNCILNYPQGCE